MDREEILEAIENMNNFPLTENQQRLVNYLESNIDDLEDAFIE